MNVVVLSFRPHVSEVQELKMKRCSVERDGGGGGNEVLQEVSAPFPVEPLLVREELALESNADRMPVQV